VLVLTKASRWTTPRAASAATASAPAGSTCRSTGRTPNAWAASTVYLRLCPSGSRSAARAIRRRSRLPRLFSERRECVHDGHGVRDRRRDDRPLEAREGQKVICPDSVRVTSNVWRVLLYDPDSRDVPTGTAYISCSPLLRNPSDHLADRGCSDLPGVRVLPLDVRDVTMVSSSLHSYGVDVNHWPKCLPEGRRELPTHAVQQASWRGSEARRAREGTRRAGASQADHFLHRQCRNLASPPRRGHWKRSAEPQHHRQRAVRGRRSPEEPVRRRSHPAKNRRPQPTRER
jgi:hypothetical protein